MKHTEDISRWSNAKKARMFIHIIAHLLIEKGGEVRIKIEQLRKLTFPIGLAAEDGDLIIAVNMDDVPDELKVQTTADKTMTWLKELVDEYEMQARVDRNCVRPPEPDDPNKRFNDGSAFALDEVVEDLKAIIDGTYG